MPVVVTTSEKGKSGKSEGALLLAEPGDEK
jgi:hypothetical protein